MGLIRVTFEGSFKRTNLMDQMYSAQPRGHAVAVQEAINFLTGFALPEAIGQDAVLRLRGAAPDDGFREAIKLGFLPKPPAKRGEGEK